jgi:membrane protease YdiL (CAAX protease family)
VRLLKKTGPGGALALSFGSGISEEVLNRGVIQTFFGLWIGAPIFGFKAKEGQCFAN